MTVSKVRNSTTSFRGGVAALRNVQTLSLLDSLNNVSVVAPEDVGCSVLFSVVVGVSYMASTPKTRIENEGENEGEKFLHIIQRPSRGIFGRARARNSSHSCALNNARKRHTSALRQIV